MGSHLCSDIHQQSLSAEVEEAGEAEMSLLSLLNHLMALISVAFESLKPSLQQTQMKVVLSTAKRLRQSGLNTQMMEGPIDKSKQWSEDLTRTMTELLMRLSSRHLLTTNTYQLLR